MKKIIILMVCLWGLGNTFTSAQTTEKEKFISSLMKQMTLDEKIGKACTMHLPREFYRTRRWKYS